MTEKYVNNTCQYNILRSVILVCNYQIYSYDQYIIISSMVFFGGNMCEMELMYDTEPSVTVFSTVCMSKHKRSEKKPLKLNQNQFR